MTDGMHNLIYAWPFEGWDLKDNPDGTKSRVDFIGGQWSKNKAHMPGVVKYVHADLYDAERQRAEKAESQAAGLAIAGDVLALRLRHIVGPEDIVLRRENARAALRRDEGAE